MEDVTINAVNLLTSYGAMGVCLVYFIFKDITITRKLNDALNEFTVAIETMLKVKGDE